MPFVNGLWVEPQKKENTIMLTQDNLVLTFIRSGENTVGYDIVYSIQITSNELLQDRINSYRRINRKSLKDSLQLYIPKNDRKYIDIKSFDTNKVIYKFLWKKWIADSIKNVKPTSQLSKMTKTFKLKISLPKMLIFNFNPYLERFLEKKVKSYMSNNQQKNWISGLIPRELEHQIKSKMTSLYDFTYDSQNNSIILKIKDIYLLGILYATGRYVNNKRQPYVKIKFQDKIKKKKGKKFDRNKWEKFINKKFI